MKPQARTDSTVTSFVNLTFAAAASDDDANDDSAAAVSDAAADDDDDEDDDALAVLMMRIIRNGKISAKSLNQWQHLSTLIVKTKVMMMIC